MKHIVISILGVLIMSSLQAQEVLFPLYTNPALKHAEKPVATRDRAGEYELPFLDDFSGFSVYPDANKWEDNFAFVNKTFGPYPPSLGMVTLDALDDTGAVYSIATPTPFQADYLTSVPIRLDSTFDGGPAALTVADSLYFSFYYQPQGYGNAPDPEDSLVLEFYTAIDDEWHHVWSTPGLSLGSFDSMNQSGFKLVMIPILDPMYLESDFQFRFRNYASIANSNLPSWQSNMDQWNIDYVYLNEGRSKSDTTAPDISFITPATSILKNYTQMPARQFNNAELRDTLHVTLSNLNSIIDNISYRYIISQDGGSFSDTTTGGDNDIYPFITNGYHDDPYQTSPVVDFTLPALTGDSISFTLRHMVGSNGWTDQIKANDTLIYHQNFYNYYSYDDGTAEAGWGLAGAGSRFAYRYTLNQPDTLGSVKMFFNSTYSPPNNRYFYLKVWSSLDPEVVVYKSTRLRPYNEDSLNKFHTYFIEDAVLILSGTFYVGWQQVTDEILNIGFDRNTDASAQMFFNTEGIWETTVYDGAVMLNPVFGTAGQSKKAEAPDGIQKLEALVFPNPVVKSKSACITVDLPDKIMALTPEETVTVVFYNYLGKKMKEVPWSDLICIDELPEGIYLLRVNSYASGESCVRELVVLK